MKNQLMSIIPFQSKYNDEIELMMTEIAKEFHNPISNSSQKRSKIPLTQYWLALFDESVIGTIGLISIKNEYCILVRMFVIKTFRGGKIGVSKMLLEHAIDWCKRNKINKLYLGTMNQFLAAHKFYEKNKFKRIDASILPKSFRRNPVDDIFYVREIEC